MRGGKRAGAGRKSSESTVRVSVPVGVLDAVNDLILAYKQGIMNDCQTIKAETLNDCQEFKQDDDLIDCHEIKQDEFLLDNQESKVDKVIHATPEIIEARKGLERLNTRACKAIRKACGSLFRAASLGVRAEPDGSFFVPVEYAHLFEGG